MGYSQAPEMVLTLVWRDVRFTEDQVRWQIVISVKGSIRVMRDKGLQLFLMVVFGAGGIGILVLAWIQPMTLHERILITFVGSVGVLWMLIHALSFMPVLKRGRISHR